MPGSLAMRFFESDGHGETETAAGQKIGTQELVTQLSILVQELGAELDSWRATASFMEASIHQKRFMPKDWPEGPEVLNKAFQMHTKLTKEIELVTPIALKTLHTIMAADIFITRKKDVSLSQQAVGVNGLPHCFLQLIDFDLYWDSSGREATDRVIHTLHTKKNMSLCKRKIHFIYEKNMPSCTIRTSYKKDMCPLHKTKILCLCTMKSSFACTRRKYLPCAQQ
jgi:hypothetical protein